jgi:DNA invertase Pin-like site-specific DNA recombinase
VEDLDVSGAVSPWKRRNLGPWLTDPDKVAAWDALVVARLDRLTRSLRDFVKLADWCNEHGKTVVSVSESLDLGTPHGRMVANILATFAQYERELASDRRRLAVATLRRHGWWNGGSLPYGYRPVPDGDHWVLEPDPETATVILRAVEMILADISASEIARRFNAEGIPTAQDNYRARSGKPARGSMWSPSALLGMLRNPALIGQSRDLDGKLYRDDSGMPVTREPILDYETWARLQHMLDTYTTGRGGRKPVAMLSGAAHCALCDGKIYATQTFSAGSVRPDGTRKPYSYYRCAAKCPGSHVVGMAKLDEAVSDMLLTAYGTEDVPEKIEIPAADHTARLAEVSELITGLDAEYRAGRLPAPVYARQIGALEAERETLAAEPVTPGRVEWRPSGVTFADYWADLDGPARNALLRKLGAEIGYAEGWLVANLRTLDDLRRAAAS